MTKSSPRDSFFGAGTFALVLLGVAAGFGTGCAGRSPVTRYYDLATPVAAARGGEQVIVLEPLSTNDAYDDERIVYRTSAYRLDYYDYHRWSAPPGVLISNYLERSLEQSGHFRAVVRDVTDSARVVLTGRVVAIEEVDLSKTAWQGHLVLELRLVDTASGETLWSEQYEESQPLTRQTPEGLAQAVSAAMGRIVDRAAPAISARLAEHVAAAPAKP